MSDEERITQLAREMRDFTWSHHFMGPYDKIDKKVYLARSGSTLFANLNTGDFSSIKVNDFTELHENIIYELATSGIADWYRINQVGTFEGKSPFFIGDF